MTFSSELLPKKKLKQTDTSNFHPSKFLLSSGYWIEPISFAYPFDFLDASTEDQFTILKLISTPQTPSTTTTDALVSLFHSLSSKFSFSYSFHIYLCVLTHRERSQANPSGINLLLKCLLAKKIFLLQKPLWVRRLLCPLQKYCPPPIICHRI